MPMTKIFSSDLKNSCIVKATNLYQIRSQGEKKLGYFIDKIVRKNDNAEIDDDDVLKELFSVEKELNLIALSDKKKGIKVSTNRGGDPKLINAINMKFLKRQAEKEFGAKIDYFFRKSDNVIIDDNRVFTRQMNLNHYWLVAVLSIDDKNSELAYKGMTSKLGSSTDAKNLSNLKTSELYDKMSLMEKELGKVKNKNSKKEEIIKKINTMSSSLVSEKEKVKELDRKLKSEMFRDDTTRIASKSEIDHLEARLLELEIKKKKIATIFKNLSNAEKVDICFMIDTTGSMLPYINETKNVIHKIVEKLRKKFTDFDLRVALVGYRDHSDGADRVTVFPFTENIDSFRSFVSSTKASGGADECEDIFGGLEEVNKLLWSNMSRVLFHIGDAPCHGKQFYIKCQDSYPSGDPRGLTITELLKNLTEKNVSYYFAEINTSTIKMIDEFNKVLNSLNGSKINVVRLDSVEDLSELVSSSISSTISETKSLSMHCMKGKEMKKIAVDRSFLTWKPNKMKHYRAILYKARFNGGVDDIKDKRIEFIEEKVEIYLAEKPFAKGAIRYAYAGLLNGKNRFVLKETASMDPEHNTMKFFSEMIETQVIAKVLAKKFFEIIKIDKNIKFLDVNLINIVETGEYYTIEEFVAGEFVKWMNNAGSLNEDIYSSALDSFSHWSYQATKEYLIVNDLQGVRLDEKRYILTDPAISSPEGFDRFSTTNLALKGIKRFFKTHQCNHICKHLKLIKHKYQILPDRNISPLQTKING